MTVNATVTLKDCSGSVMGLKAVVASLPLLSSEEQRLLLRLTIESATRSTTFPPVVNNVAADDRDSRIANASTLTRESCSSE
jgi:hypothetical protein